MPLDTSEQRSRASYVVRESAKRLPNDRRVQLVSELPRLLDVNFPAEMPEEFAPLDWREVREMDGNFVDFGAHTVTHPTLSNIADERELWHEIEGCKARIEQELRRPVLHFCYPSGQLVDIRPEPVDIARRAGYLTAVTSENGFNSYAADPFLLRRIGVEPALPDVYFRELIAGLPQIFKAQPAVTPQFTKEES